MHHFVESLYMNKHRNNIALHWKYLEIPARPTKEDISILEKIIREYKPNRHLRALLLGVTPEIVSMSWPSETLLDCVDKSQEMIKNVWPKNILNTQAYCCD